MTSERRSQETRSKTTKQQILDAAIAILFTRGFGAATVQNVATAAGVSRGAMLHHFPSKSDLLVAVFVHAHQIDLSKLGSELEKLETPFDRLHSLAEVTWNVLSGPSGIAGLEIMMGSRSDRELADRLEPVQSQIEKDSHRRVKQLLEAAGVRDSSENANLIEMAVAAIRGLTIERLFRRGGGKPPASLQTLQSLVEARLKEVRET